MRGELNPIVRFRPFLSPALDPANLSPGGIIFAIQPVLFFALRGGHVIGGYADQGLATEPNGSAKTGIKGHEDGNSSPTGLVRARVGGVVVLGR